MTRGRAPQTFRQPTRNERRPGSPAQDRSRGLPTIATGALRTRWTRYRSEGGTQVPIPVNINCWRATIYFSDPSGNNTVWDGIQLREIFVNNVSGENLVVVIGGAMYDERPVYLNETHYFATGGAGEILVVEEFYDGAIQPNN